MVSCPMNPIYVKSRQAQVHPNFQGRKPAMFADTQNVKPLKKDLGLVDSVRPP